MNVPVLGRDDLSMIKVGRPAWDRVHKHSIRAALVLGRGAITVRENPASIPIRDAPAFAEGFNTDAKANRTQGLSNSWRHNGSMQITERAIATEVTEVTEAKKASSQND
eukprot:1153086-Pelagomonas_calceolata.AAC.3